MYVVQCAMFSGVCYSDGYFIGGSGCTVDSYSYIRCVSILWCYRVRYCGSGGGVDSGGVLSVH